MTNMSIASSLRDPHSILYPSLNVVCNRMSMIRGAYTENEKNNKMTRGSYLALCKTIEFLSTLRKEPLLTPEEIGVIRVQTFKGIPRKSSNVSMTFSTALAFFDGHQDENHVLLLNCGTGCVKFQLYSRNEEKPVYDYNPSDVDDGANRTSLSGLRIGSHNPSADTSITREMFISTTRQWLYKVLSYLETTGVRNIDVSALVTGSIRTT